MRIEREMSIYRERMNERLLYLKDALENTTRAYTEQNLQ
jgi:hypothetical protein